jgi:hypothetical protein
MLGVRLPKTWLTSPKTKTTTQSKMYEAIRIQDIFDWSDATRRPAISAYESARVRGRGKPTGAAFGADPVRQWGGSGNIRMSGPKS